VIAKILRWSLKAVLVLLLLAVAAMVTFWVAASVRETGLRDELAPSTGHLVPTGSGRVFVQEKGPADGNLVIASEAKQSSLTTARLDCFVACAPRNDEEEPSRRVLLIERVGKNLTRIVFALRREEVVDLRIGALQLVARII
jgi:hypothetical protein